MRAAWFAMLGLACVGPTAPCDLEPRWGGKFESWRTACLAPQSNGVQFCAVWPTPPEAPDWLGDSTAMAARGVLMRRSVVCADLPITRTPGAWP